MGNIKCPECGKDYNDEKFDKCPYCNVESTTESEEQAEPETQAEETEEKTEEE